jgi:hypothetical protein
MLTVLDVLAEFDREGRKRAETCALGARQSSLHRPSEPRSARPISRVIQRY